MSCVRKGAPSLLPINLHYYFTLSVSLPFMPSLYLRLPGSLSANKLPHYWQFHAARLKVYRRREGRKKGGGNSLTSATKSLWNSAGTVFFHLNCFQRRRSRIRSLGPLAAWLHPAIQRQLSFLAPASLCPWTERQQVKSKLFFRSFFVQSEHIGEQPSRASGPRNKRSPHR